MTSRFRSGIMTRNRRRTKTTYIRHRRVTKTTYIRIRHRRFIRKRLTKVSTNPDASLIAKGYFIMTIGEGSNLSPPRTKGTPSGFRNVRVLVTQDLHFRLLSYASQSHLSMPAFVVAWLNRATPLEPTSTVPTKGAEKESAPGQPPGQGIRDGQWEAVGPGSAQGEQWPDGHRSAQGPRKVPGEGGGPGAAHRQTALAASGPGQTADPASSWSSPTPEHASSASGQDLDQAEAGGHEHD